ncbi:hypothetical protein BVC80_1183g63 [Macleaya cordata]|uniref:Peptidase S1 n=1 Tax=Macleaya cordata TaxID=56857 RepID=A0A200PQ65_MACCD|nr:hypothetical protein BVC80_1183g63 [Macleaya cordata]
MELPEIVEFARNFAVMVRIQGPDPKGLKMRKHAFHHYQSGKTTLSASGFLLPDSFIDFPIVKHIRQHSSASALVVTVASIVEPFISLQHRENNTQDLPQLIQGVQIDVLMEGKVKEQDNLPDELDNGTPWWLHSELLALVDVPVASRSLQSLVEAPASSPEHGSWEVGWSLASLNNGHQVGHDTRSSLESRRHSLSESSNPSLMAMSTTRIAFLGVSALNCEDLPNLHISPTNKRGDLLLAMGSPFGILSPVHFLNSISVGSVANCYPSSSYNSSLLMADIRCLPGMEGGPVFGEHAELIGIVSRPLRQKVGGAEIQLVIPWVAIATVWSEELQNEHQKAAEVVGNKENLHALETAHFSDSLVSHSSLKSPIEKAMSSIVLITVDDGAWASGVLLNNEGLILTNAHLLEPWRFGKTTVQGGKDQTTLASLPIISEELVSPWHGRSESQEGRQELRPKMVKISPTSKGDEQHQYRMASIYKSYKKIRVRLDHTNPWIWSDARLVYVSKGPLDVAVLQLESVPNQLCPIIPNFECPTHGSKAHVIGHGLFGPRCDAYPSVCSGVVGRVVKAQNSLYSSERGLQVTTKRDLPAMLETTAAVHPGGSGGAVVNSDGHMIGLVTSNARHGGGTVIPHLNFSIPSAALEPIFKFSKDMQDLSILQILDKPNENLSSVWALMPPLSPRPVPVPPFLDPPKSLAEANTKDGKEKGSRFAKFISERHGEMFPRPNQLVKVENFLKKTIPSKL